MKYLIIRFAKILLLIIIVIAVLPYLLCPFYKYPEPKPFSGKQYYNPYENIDSTAWKKANFHEHTRRWRGLTAGSNSPEDTVVKRYRELGYDIAAISDYQHINTVLSGDPNYLPVYEHGYGIAKTHHLVIGATGISWDEFTLFQTFHNKQNVINSIRNDGEVIALTHPHLRNAYPPDDIKYLRDFDLIEVSNHSYSNAADLWDTVLSAGNPVFAIAGDDGHEIKNPANFGYVYTMLNSRIINSENVKSALKKGMSYAVELEPVDDKSPKMKIEQSAMVPVIRKCSVVNDTLTMKFDRPCDTLVLYGQNGAVRGRVLNTDSVTYAFNQQDTYIRAEVNQKTLTSVYLNPVFRYNGTIERTAPEIDSAKTWAFRFIYIICIAILTFLYIRYKRKKGIRAS